MEAWIAHIFIGPLILGLSLIFKFFPPKKINSLYGYRTAFSMKSQEVWDEGNRYSSNLLVIVSLITSLTQVVWQLLWPGEWAFLGPVIIMCVLLIASVPLTEKHLKKHFNEDGTAKE
jgi:uncharacterized membrane protein